MHVARRRVKSKPKAGPKTGSQRLGIGSRRETRYSLLRSSPACGEGRATDEAAAVAVISEATAALVEGIAREAERRETPCGDGTMVWRLWGSGPPLVLLHGGYGSWTHWIRNVPALARQFRVVAPDLPGLGESATPPEPWTAEGLAAIVVAGLDRILLTGAGGERPHLAGFSFGGVIGGQVAAQLGDRLRGFTVVGSNGLGVERSPTPLRRVPAAASEEEEFATHRFNLNQLMIADPAKIDELALYLQKINHARARMRSRRFSRSDALAHALPLVTARLDGIWGERDATAYPRLDERARLLRSFQPAARFAVVPGAGHWVQYEAADRFNALIAEFAAGA
jgi:2-hydroxy-6-oxonona-2,4-dienedioate hydrolase